MYNDNVVISTYLFAWIIWYNMYHLWKYSSMWPVWHQVASEMHLDVVVNVGMHKSHGILSQYTDRISRQ